MDDREQLEMLLDVVLRSAMEEVEHDHEEVLFPFGCRGILNGVKLMMGKWRPVRSLCHLNAPSSFPLSIMVNRHTVGYHSPLFLIPLDT